MSQKAVITVNGPMEEVVAHWQSYAYHPEYIEKAAEALTFEQAPGDHGTEIHVDLDASLPGGRLGELVQKITTGLPLAKARDDLRHFKAHYETGEVPRSDGTPEGERVARKLKQRPAQPMSREELQEVMA